MSDTVSREEYLVYKLDQTTEYLESALRQVEHLQAQNAVMVDALEKWAASECWCIEDQEIMCTPHIALASTSEQAKALMMVVDAARTFNILNQQIKENPQYVGEEYERKESALSDALAAYNKLKEEK